MILFRGKVRKETNAQAPVSYRMCASPSRWFENMVPTSQLGRPNKKLTPFLDVRGHSSLRESFFDIKNVRLVLVRTSLRCLLYVRPFPLIHQGSKKENAKMPTSWIPRLSEVPLSCRGGQLTNGVPIHSLAAFLSPFRGVITAKGRIC